MTRVGDITVKVSETGTVEPVDKVDVKSKVAGRLLSIPIEEGQRVTRGQLIATVDRSLIDPQIARARAQMVQAQARLQQSVAEYRLQVNQSSMAVAQAQAGLRTAQANLAGVEANLRTARAHLVAAAAPARPQELAQQEQAVARAQIALDDAERTRKRKAGLLARGFVSQADFDSSQAATDTAASQLVAARQQLALVQAGPRPQDIADVRSQVDAARTQVIAARTQVDAARVQVASAKANAAQNDVRRGDIDQARAAVQQAQNDLQQLLVQLGDTQIIAPASGIVLKKYKEPNEIVQSATTGFSDAQSIVATLGSRLLVRVGINEVDIPKVQQGAPVVVHVDALPGVNWTGHVSEIAPASANAFDTSGGGSSGGGQGGISKFSVKVALDASDSRLRPGMTAGVDIISQRHTHVVLAPLEAIPDTGTTATATVLTAPAHQEKHPVTLGLRNDTDVEIVKGLRAGETLVIPPINGKGRRKIDISSGPG